LVFYNNIPLTIEEENAYQIHFTFDRVEQIDSDLLKDLVSSLNNVTFIHHTKLNADYLKSVPNAKKIIGIFSDSLWINLLWEMS